MQDLTVIYYTNNQEKPAFAERIRQVLLGVIGDLPLISVSQEPMDFGRNICVGKVGSSSQNAYRQLQIGAQEAKTTYICTAEADFIYPREYFEFIPDGPKRAYLAQPVFVAMALRGKGKYYAPKPRGSEAAMVVGRKYLISCIDRMLHGLSLWGPMHADGINFPYLMHIARHSYFYIDTPVITFKTDRNMHRGTPHSIESRTRYLEPFGEVHTLLDKFL